MRIAVGLCVLGLLCLHSSVFGQQAADVHPGVLIFCDDPSVEKAVHSSLHKFNKEVVTGHKLALYQIKSASKSENGSDSVYSLHFTSRRSDCPAGSSKAWTECDYLPSRHKKAIECNATVLMTETEAQVQQVDCKIEDPVVPEKAQCMGCPKEIAENSEDLKAPVLAAISKFNSMSNSTHLFTLHDVDHATRQVVAGFRYKVKFDLRRSICTKEEHKELHELCLADEENMEFVNCNCTVDMAPWRLESPTVMIQCEQGPLIATFSRRRPPGFSPLRATLFGRPSAASTPTQPPPPPTPNPTKDESSEEDLATPSPTASGDPNDNLFHCPSKPWKAFRPSRVGAPEATKAPVEEASPPPTAAGTFSDADLLS